MESDVNGSGADQRPILASGIGQRISLLAQQLGDRKTAAKAAGISADTLQRYIREEVQPSFEPIARMAIKAGVRLDWVATGLAPQFKDVTDVQRFDVNTLQTALETLEKGLQIMGRTVTDPAAKAHLVAQVYSYLTDDKQDASTQMLNLLKLVK